MPEFRASDKLGSCDFNREMLARALLVEKGATRQQLCCLSIRLTVVYEVCAGFE